MSSSESEDEDWILYREREEWKDVVPIPQDDGPHPVVAIAYSDRCMILNFHLTFFCSKKSLALIEKPPQMSTIIKYHLSPLCLRFRLVSLNLLSFNLKYCSNPLPCCATISKFKALNTTGYHSVNNVRNCQEF